jgi:hypothetical protein
MNLFKGYGPVLGLVILLFAILAIVGAEGFTSTGTIVQLETSHVPPALSQALEGLPFLPLVERDVPTAQELNDMECLGGLYKCNYRNILFGFGP